MPNAKGQHTNCTFCGHTGQFDTEYERMGDTWGITYIKCPCCRSRAPIDKWDTRLKEERLEKEVEKLKEDNRKLTVRLAQLKIKLLEVKSGN